jgi:AraC-like DNA-binding protein
MKAYTGMTLRGCLIFYRVSAAKELLASTDIPITDISESCGFSTPSYFSEMFLRCEGINPREYRKKMRSIII